MNNDSCLTQMKKHLSALLQKHPTLYAKPEAQHQVYSFSEILGKKGTHRRTGGTPALLHMH